MRVLGWSRSLTPEAAARAGVTWAALPDLMAASDVVTVHVRAAPETRGLIGADLIGRMRADAILINTSRASLVDEGALHAALAEGRIGGAGLDVFGEEPLPADHRWARLDNVVMTSHRGWTTRETLDRFMGAAVDNALAFLDGAPRHVVNPGVLA
jgi:phosphoglycerate dehydrogenase-like enzyme